MEPEKEIIVTTNEETGEREMEVVYPKPELVQ